MVKTPIVHTQNYTILDNKFIQDKNLSAFATVILAYALSLPNEWKFNLENFKARFDCGEKAVYKALKELEEKKYLSRKRIIEKSGRFGAIIYHFYEIPYDQINQNQINFIEKEFAKTEVDFSISQEKEPNVNLPHAVPPRAVPPRAVKCHMVNNDAENEDDNFKINLPYGTLARVLKEELINTNIINTNKKKKDVYKYTSKKEEKTEPKAPSPLATELLAEFEKSLKENLPEIKGKRPTQGACYLEQLLKNYSVEEIKAVIKFSHTDEFWKLHVHTPSYLKTKFSQLLVALRRPPKPKISFDKPKIDRTQDWWDGYAPTCNPEQCATDEEKIALGLIPSHLKEKYKAQGGKV